MRIGLKDVEENIKPLGGRLSYDKDFIFELLAAYGRSSSNITRLKNGQLNVADDKDNEIAQKNVVYFKPATGELYPIIDDLQSSPTVVRYSTRFVIVTDYQQLLAIDTKTGETLDINIRDISRHYAFFLPWAGMEKAQFITENHADVKAAEKMAKLFDLLIEHNGYKTSQDWHYLTTFFTRLLFCYFAEDTNIFKKNQFINAIASYTKEDGSDMRMFLTVLFESLDEKDKGSLPAHIADFPYVNGQLFSGISEIPHFNKEARKILIESASQLDWSDINPDIFGSMFQAVVRPSERTGLGQHYTSVPNIMKTIEPLFLDELKNEFNKNYDDVKKLDALLLKMSQVKVFDPACGSGNFLIIAYKELRRLEHAILERQGELRPHQAVLFGSRINIENFYGIEIDDFAHEVAILSLWLAKHQMNLEFSEKFGIDLPLIPLKEAGNIVHGNAATLDWSEVCPNSGDEEIYIIGNPPYAGSSMQNADQKRELADVCKGFDNYKNLDYISVWFIKAAQFIRGTKAKSALVSTNSICQGEQVALLWPHIIDDEINIEFAYTSFKWSNNAKHNAGVTCVIVALAKRSTAPKHLYVDQLRHEVANINAYLSEGTDTYIPRRGKPISSIPEMVYGNKATDGGHLILEDKDRRVLLDQNPEAAKFVKLYIGSEELMKGIKRYCLWIEDDELREALQIPYIKKRLEAVTTFRLKSKAESTNDYAQYPNRFKQRTYKPTHSIIIPRVTSEKREYMTIEYLDANTVISDAAFAMYDAEPWAFGIISSKMHAVWVKKVAGQLETRIRYSSAIAYNNFPIPLLTSTEKEILNGLALAVIDARESHPDKNIRYLYEPETMPDDLRDAHNELDKAVDSLYRKRPFESDEERISVLFNLYETMTSKERQVL